MKINYAWFDGIEWRAEIAADNGQQFYVIAVGDDPLDVAQGERTFNHVRVSRSFVEGDDWLSPRDCAGRVERDAGDHPEAVQAAMAAWQQY